MNDDPIDQLLLTLVIVSNIALFAVLLSYLPRQPLEQSIHDLSIACIFFFLQVAIVVVADCDLPWLDD